MSNWLSAINASLSEAMPAVLVTVAVVEGSGPREPARRCSSPGMASPTR
ncbi:hypothetical protein [Noviherbaspirillum saxi]